MGYIFVSAACAACGGLFSFHPNKVPSVVTGGRREPVCASCVEAANPLRAAKGLPAIEVLPGAYEPCSEDDVDWNEGRTP